MSDQTTKRLRDALAACEAVETFLAGCSLSFYREEYGLRLQIERLLEIIGEALHQASVTGDEIQDQIPQLRAIVGMRNRIIHGYSEVDDQLIWLTATNRVPELRSQIESILNSKQST
jgi:uncharacterized protein with HEPN domain